MNANRTTSAAGLRSSPRVNAFARINALVDWFIPHSLAADRDRRQQARMFLISHIFGPFLGNSVPLALTYIDPQPGYQVVVLAASITGFWIFPFLLRAGFSYNALAMVSIENLIFCIMWSIFFYGGITSPTVPWVLTIPLLAFLYLNATPKLWGFVPALFIANLLTFWAAARMGIAAPRPNLPFDQLQIFGMISTAAAAGYVAMMATYYGKALASQSELETEMRQHLATAAQLRRATEETERARSAKGEFLARMSHELRTPLNAVIGYSQILLEDAGEEGDEAMADDLGKIHGAGHELLKLVNEVLDLSKIEAGRMEISRVSVDVSCMVEASVAPYRAKAAAAGLGLFVESNGDLGLAWWDETKVRQALTQLLDNALKFTSSGHVRVVARALVECGLPTIRIAIEDTGAGIAASALPDLFEQFAAEKDASASKYGGRGLGLSLAQQLCRLMGGDVTVGSQLGAGSVFTLSLPRGAVTTAETIDIDRAVDAQIARLRRLIVEKPPAPPEEKIA